jgi:hypothetical protein
MTKPDFRGRHAPRVLAMAPRHRELCSEFDYEHEREQEQGDADVADFGIGHWTLGVRRFLQLI